MLAFLLILGMAYVVAYRVGAYKSSYRRAAAGFTLAVMVAWIFGSILVAQGAAFLDGLLGRMDGRDTDTKQLVLTLFQRGVWWAVIGAGVGTFRARRRIRHQQDVPASVLPRWEGKIVLAVILFGAMLAVAIPEYQNYTRRSQEPRELYQAQQSAAEQPRIPPQASAPSAAPQVSTDSKPAVDAAVDEHLNRIYAAHPDADAIFASADFRAWMTRYPAYQRIASEGTTQEVIEMFTAYKNQRQSNPFGEPNYGK
ncbi:hypothetical protein [Pseudomonas sp. 30_B]|uniref:hypothetical protein n=1 Tax=Pseudomonas sp. 30_B TaxID=2813575 RepID=UPI001A9DAF32|nr:hypothetical protein [Pseudomonas sp. 30_B]